MTSAEQGWVFLLLQRIACPPHRLIREADLPIQLQHLESASFYPGGDFQLRCQSKIPVSRVRDLCLWEGLRDASTEARCALSPSENTVTFSPLGLSREDFTHSPSQALGTNLPLGRALKMSTSSGQRAFSRGPSGRLHEDSVQKGGRVDGINAF